MIRYFNTLIEITRGYRLYLFLILIMEGIFFLKYNAKFNKFKYLNSNNSSDPIPAPFYILKKIEKFILKKNIKSICDLGSGFGKIIYFFGKVKEYQIDGVELDNDIYKDTLSLQSLNVSLYNENILEFNLDQKKYDLLIINDPLKNKKDFENLIKKINNLHHKVFIIIINVNLDKVKLASNYLKIIDQKIFSLHRNILFYENRPN